MSAQKKRGLGRGLGALIPSGPEGDRPVDVFFPSSDRTDGATEVARVDGDSVLASGPSDAKLTGRSTSWEAAMSSGRLAIRTNGAARSGTVREASGPVVNPEVNGVDLGTAGVAAENIGTEVSEAVAVGSVVALDESGATDPTDLTVVTGPVPVITGSLATVTPIGSVRVPHDALASRGATDAIVDTGFAGLAGVSRETEEHRDSDDLLPVPGATFAELPIDAIRPNTWQPRTVFDEGDLDELVESIKEIGVLQPIVVRPDKTGSGQYELIMGERRWRASELAGRATVPAIIRETDDADMLRDALLENLHRVQLNPLEEAAAYRQLLDDFGCTHEELATRIARSRPQISNTLRLLKLPPLVQRRVAAGILSAGHARALLSITDGAEIERLAQRIVSEGLSVRATEEIVSLLTSGGDEPKRRVPRAGQRSVAVDELAGRLSDLFETRVKVQVGKSKGRLTVEFASVEDLNRILGVMAPQDPGLLKQ